MKRQDAITLVFGAGASRAVSYAHLGAYPSPLDGDFFDLLQRIETKKDKDQAAIEFVLEQVRNLPDAYRQSMERTFYTLHLRSYLRRKLRAGTEAEEQRIVGNFARAIQALLRRAHAKRCCEHHETLLRSLRDRDAILSFNYDLVVERALRSSAAQHNAPFSKWLYRIGPRPRKYALPGILKLHGSSNWALRPTAREFEVRTECWEDFDEQPGYLGHSGAEGTVFPIFLPFWDKRIERHPWLRLWREAADQLSKTTTLIVWGYSLPPTDIKAQQLFQISLPETLRLCVIDPSRESRQRWRDLLPRAQYWEYERIQDYFSFPPTWWRSERSSE